MICRSAACKLAGNGALPRQGTISCLDTVASRRRLQTVHWTVSILRIALFDSLFFTSKKEVSKNDTSFFGAEGETRPLKAKAIFSTHAGTETVHRTVSILRNALFDSLFFTSKKEVSKNDTSFFGAEGETRTLAPVTRPTPLAGAPRHQLEYFCKLTG